MIMIIIVMEKTGEDVSSFCIECNVLQKMVLQRCTIIIFFLHECGFLILQKRTAQSETKKYDVKKRQKSCRNKAVY